VVRVLFGLDAHEGRERLPIGASANDATVASGTSPANVYLALGRCRTAWAAHPAIADLSSVAQTIVNEANGALPLADAAERLLLRLPYDRSRASSDVVVEAAALLRAVAESERETPEGTPAMTLVRVSDLLWICASSEHGAAVRDLGRAADDLAQRSPLASAPETQAALAEAAAGTPFASLPIDRLVVLAARASDHAAISTRLEMYPQGMPAARAVELTAAVLTAKGVLLTPDEVRKRVADRYPNASPVPDRPGLDDLLRPYGLEWNGNSYVRPAEDVRTGHTTRASTLTRYQTALPTQVRDESPEAIEGRDVDHRLAQAVERKQLRILVVRADQVLRATFALGKRLHVPVRRVDRLLIEAMERRADDDGVEIDVLHETDNAGSSAADWPNLVELARDAIADVSAALLPAREPLVLTHFGLVERYRLQSFLDAIAEASRRDDCEAIFLVVPAHDEAGPTLFGGLTVPGLLPSQRLRVTGPWIQNHHNAAAPAA
jgi:hypothetical protein